MNEGVIPESLARLRTRTSSKWRAYPPDVLPLFVAETDFELAPCVQDALASAVRRGDTGYVWPSPELPEAFAGFAAESYAWTVDPADVRVVPDVMVGVAELLRILTEPGDGVIVTPPVYPPFFACQREVGAHAVPVPLVRSHDGYALDLDGIEAAFAGGARVLLLCNPHNPTGTAHSPETLAAVAEIAARHAGWVISDEIHAPLAHPGQTVTAFLSASDTARAVGFCVTSASKAFNLAGLKCAQLVAASPETRARQNLLSRELAGRSGMFGVIASIAAYTDGRPWLATLVDHLASNQRLLQSLLAEHVPEALSTPGQAGFLGWVDLSQLGWGDDPSARILRDARVALNSGLTFGDGGAGHVRINFGTSEEILTDAIERIGRLTGR